MHTPVTMPRLAAICALALVANNLAATEPTSRAPQWRDRPQWTEVNPDASWAPRAGLQVVELHNTFFLMGGRTPIDPAVLPVPGASVIWSDVWRSRDLGRSWQKLVETDTPGHWPARAYFQAVTRGNAMYVLGGQNFNLVPNPGCAFLPPGVPCDPPIVPASDFFIDFALEDHTAQSGASMPSGIGGQANPIPPIFTAPHIVEEVRNRHEGRVAGNAGWQKRAAWIGNQVEVLSAQHIHGVALGHSLEVGPRRPMAGGASLDQLLPRAAQIAASPHVRPDDARPRHRQYGRINRRAPAQQEKRVVKLNDLQPRARRPLGVGIDLCPLRATPPLGCSDRKFTSRKVIGNQG